MAFDWLNKFQPRVEKEPDYAVKTLAAYRLPLQHAGAKR
jgi:hypothetical protein